MRILVFRSGAFGDVLVITPVLRYLHSQGHDLYVIVNERGMQVLKNNPHVKLIIEQKTDSVLMDQLSKHISYMQTKHKCERVIDFSESIEVALSLHPRSPDYKLPKYERLEKFNKNFYEYSFQHAIIGYPELHENLIHEQSYRSPFFASLDFYKPELFFDQSELDEASKYLKPDYFNVLFGMSGSGHNKAYPYWEDLAERLCKEIPDAHIITVGDERCRLIEPEIEGRITNLSGKIPMRTSMALTGLVDLVVSPDTGLLHASGCYLTPKIALLGHTTPENITKHFTNCYNVVADSKKAECSPCFYLIYNMKLQCPLNPVTNSSICMADGINNDMIMEKVRIVRDARLQKTS